tara:strand:+ start:831 stop:1610 length:780 start_codon:yes stop_codon:yes gene_type:complete
MKIGVLQGRLSPPTKGHIQEFPINWLKEFELLKAHNLNHIEWIVTTNSFEGNPLFDKSSGLNLSDLPIHSVCADNLVDKKFANLTFLEANLIPICESAGYNDIKNITIPLLEDSSIENDELRKQFCDNIVKITSQYSDLVFSFEAELAPEKLIELLKLSDNHVVTYDTGNITSCGLDHIKYINLLHEKINNVHLKDRTFDARTVAPSTGDTNFNLIFKTLKSAGYDGVYTLQTAREKPGAELETILMHRNLFKGMYNEC